MALDSFRRPYWLVYVPIIMVVAAAAGCTSMLAGNTGGTYSLLRLAILLVVAGAVLFWRRWRLHAVIGLALWAFVASPMVTNRQFLGFQDTPPPGLQPLSQAPALLRGDAWDSGVYMATMAEKNYLNGEGSYAHADLVAWTVTWLPWPHLSRAQIIGIGGNFDEFWIFEEEIRAGTATGRGRLRRAGGRHPFAATHVSTLPAAGLHAPTDEMPAAWWVWELGSHVVYGVTVDLVRRAVRRALG